MSPTNHFSPVLDKPSYYGCVDENSPSGTSILTIIATDGDTDGTDAGTIAAITLSGADASNFYINYTSDGVGILMSQ